MRKNCRKCGYSLVLLSSQNTKYCVNCHDEIDWELDEDQASIYGDRNSTKPED